MSSDYVSPWVTEDDPLIQLVQQWSGHVQIGNKRFLTGRDHILLASLRESENTIVRDFSEVMMELSAYAEEPESLLPLNQILVVDGIPEGLYDAAFQHILSIDERAASMRSLVGLLTSPLDARFKQDCRRLALYILGQRSTNSLCLIIEEEFRARTPMTPLEGRLLPVTTDVSGGKVVLTIRNNTGAALHNCYIRSRVLNDGELVDALERGYKEGNSLQVALYSMAGLPAIVGARADQAMMDFQRIDKYRPHFVYEWKPRARLTIELQNLDPIVRIGKAADVLLLCDEGACVLPVSIGRIRKEYGEGIPVGRW